MFQHVFSQILSPAIQRKPLQIGAPFGKAITAWEQTPNEQLIELDGETYTAFLAKLRTSVPLDAGVFPSWLACLSTHTVTLAACMHDVVAAMHPELRGFLKGGAPELLLEKTSEILERIPPPSSIGEILVRHVWLGSLPAYQCIRAEVRFWVGKRVFYGQEPPSRLMAWPSLRRVQRLDEPHSFLQLSSLFGEPNQELHRRFERALRAFFRATPLTDLLHREREFPQFQASELHSKVLALPLMQRILPRLCVA